MSAQAHTRHTCGCHGGSGAVAVERNRYFTGKFMAARDFAVDTDYLLDRHRLHNRLLHGWGIVCGLVPKPHPRPECERDWVVVGSGLAIDCYGRELVLEKDTAFRLPLPDNDDADCEPRDEPFLLCARFRQQEVEPVPALYAEGNCDPHRQEFNRYREGVELVVADVTRRCWPIEHHHHHHHHDESVETSEESAAESEEDSAEHEHEHHHDHDHHHHGHDCGCEHCHEECLTPHCACGDLVPLARVIPLEGGGYELDLEGRRQQPPPPPLLTHITHVNWPHGGRLSLHDIRHDLHGKLKVRFDRPLREYEHDHARGINPYTFVVQYASGPTETVEFLPYPDDEPPRLEDDGCTAVFTIDPDYLHDRARRSLHNVTVYVSLRCDFIVDCRGIPVDGNHLRGRLPSGDGVQGGLFESWFEVREHHRRDEES